MSRKNITYLQKKLGQMKAKKNVWQKYLSFFKSKIPAPSFFFLNENVMNFTKSVGNSN